MAKTSPSQCRGLGLIPGQGTKSHIPQLKVHILQLKIQSAKTKTQLSQIKKFLINKIKSIFRDKLWDLGFQGRLYLIEKMKGRHEVGWYRKVEVREAATVLHDVAGPTQVTSGPAAPRKWLPRGCQDLRARPPASRSNELTSVLLSRLSVDSLREKESPNLGKEKQKSKFW